MATPTWPWSFAAPEEPESGLPGAGLWWRPLLRLNTEPGAASHPFRCAIPGCKQLYSKGVGATRIRNHVLGVSGGGIAKCSAAKPSDRIEAAKHEPQQKASSSANQPSSDNRATAETAAGLPQVASSSRQQTTELAMTPKRRKLVDDAREEKLRNANLGGMFRHMMRKEDADKLDVKWAMAFANSCLPSNILENDYFRDAVFATSLASAPYSAPRRRQMDRSLLLAYDERLAKEVQASMSNTHCRILGFDGWESTRRQPLNNYMLLTENGDEFLDNELMEGKDKTASALANLAMKYIKLVHIRYPPKLAGRPSVLGICTDNPTVMRQARALLTELIREDEDLCQNFFFDWPCLLHAESSLLNDQCKLPFFKRLLAKHKLIVRTFRNKQWLRYQLGIEQEKRSDEYKDRFGRPRPLTLIQSGETRIGSVPRSAVRNLKLRSALDGVVSHPEFFGKCGISKGRAAAATAEEVPEDDSEDDSCEDDDDEADISEDEEHEGSVTPAAQKQKRYLDLRVLIRDDLFWKDTEEMVQILSPVLRDLKFADEDRPLMGFVWPMMLALHRKAEAMLLPAPPAKYDGRMPLQEREKFCELIMTRWAYLHVPMHSTAYTLNPRFHGADHFSDPEVREDFLSVLRQMLETEDEVSTALNEYRQYHKKLGPWSDPLIWLQAQQIEPYEFWEDFGSNTLKLGNIAVQILAAQHSASGGERNWSLQGRINTKLRNRQHVTTLSRLTRLAANQKLVDRKKGRGAKKAAAILRINARRRGAPAPPCSAPRPYPLDDDKDWQSCNESGSDDDDDNLVLGPRPDVHPHLGRQIIRSDQ
jgi:hypothetical protein